MLIEALSSIHRTQPLFRKNRTNQVKTDQTHIGWDKLYYGLISSQWLIMQQAYYESISSKKRGSSWAIKLVLRLWEMQRHMWDHRNTALHKLQNQQHHQETILRLNNLIRPFFRLPGFSEENDVTLEFVLSLPLQQKQQWLATQSALAARRARTTHRGQLSIRRLLPG